MAAQADDSVSIHAPAWGATSNDKQLPRLSRFNPRARVGRDMTGGIIQF